MSLRLTGQSLDPAVDSNLNDGALADLVKDATASRSFARLWADKLTKAWFTQGGIPLDDPRITAIKRHIADYIDKGTPFNRMPVELLGADIESKVNLSDSTNSPPPTPTTKEF